MNVKNFNLIFTLTSKMQLLNFILNELWLKKKEKEKEKFIKYNHTK